MAKKKSSANRDAKYKSQPMRTEKNKKRKIAKRENRAEAWKNNKDYAQEQSSRGYVKNDKGKWIKIK